MVAPNSYPRSAAAGIEYDRMYWCQDSERWTMYQLGIINKFVPFIYNNKEAPHAL